MLMLASRFYHDKSIELMITDADIDSFFSILLIPATFYLVLLCVFPSCLCCMNSHFIVHVWMCINGTYVNIMTQVIRLEMCRSA